MKLVHFIGLTLSLCLNFVGIEGHAKDNQSHNNKHFSIEKTNASAVIDGELKEELWSKAMVISDFHQIYPNAFAAPALDTEVRVIYNQEFLYISAKLYDDNMDDLSRNVIVPGQGIWQDDMFGVSIDTFKNGKDSYYFATNINEFKEEGIGVGNQNYIGEWDGIWHVATSEHENYWIVEMAIPFKTLSFNPENSQWGINFLRELTRPDQIIYWNSHGHTPRPWTAEHMGTVANIKDISQGQGLDIKLSATGSNSKDYLGNISESEFKPSLDIFYKPSPEVTTALTVNTDFSATEVDQQQVNLTRFSLFLPEKRDFFLQDAGVFEFAKLSGNGQPFFSRTIGLSNTGAPLDINVGAKVTGKIDNSSFGFIGINQTFEQNQKDNLFAFRGTTDVSDGFQAGIITTKGSQSLEQENQLWGADLQYRNSKWSGDKTLEWIGWYQQSSFEEIDRDEVGKAWGTSIALPNETLNARLAYMEIDQDFMPGLGFVNRTGIQQLDGWVSISNPYIPSFANRLFHTFSFEQVSDLDGNLQTASYTFTLAELLTTDSSFFLVEYVDEFDFVKQEFEILPELTVPAGEYDNSQSTLVYLNEQTLPIEVAVSWTSGDFYDGSQNEWFVTLADNVNTKLRLGFDLSYNRIELPAGSFSVKTLSSKVDIAFSSKLYWNNWFQYNNVSEQLGVFSRLRWQPNSLTQFDFVLNHVYLDEDSFNSYRQDVSAKLSYTMRY